MKRKKVLVHHHFQDKHTQKENFLLDSTSCIFTKHINARLWTSILLQGTLGDFHIQNMI
jgi:hypothetical protein